ncbi:hypothetical protein [Paraburkholderia sp. BL25I1N1]|nr:hypothetical protein [Paraburkholderia sp. BL25I1N1]
MIARTICFVVVLHIVAIMRALIRQGYDVTLLTSVFVTSPH